jgi:hypothetical protein
MAFEAFVASGAARRERAHRVGVVVSLALHIPPIVLFALQLVVRPVLVDRTEELPGMQASPVVPVKIARLWAPAPPRQDLEAARPGTIASAAAARAAKEPPARKRRRAPAIPPASASPVHRLEIPGGGEVPSGEAERSEALAMLHTLKPPSADLERRAAAVRTEILTGLSADPAVPPTSTRSAGPHAGGEGDPRPGPVHELTPGAAAYLRTYETFPSLPDGSYSWRKRSYVFYLQVCVAENGLVDEVVVKRGARPDLDAHLSTAIRTWRYRPWIVSGSPRPFCHPLRITYTRG